MNNTPHYVLYARKSTESEDKQMLSIPAQLRELREFAARAGLDIADELTESCSAREPGRPVFSKLLRNVAAGRVFGIICWKLDRLARNPIDGGALTHYLGKKLLREIVTPDGRYDGSGDSKFMLSVLFGAATKMTDDLSVAVKRGNKEIHLSGRITGNPPLGYTKVRDKAGLRGAGKVVPDPERFAIMQRAWKELASGTTTVAAVWRRAVGEWGLTSRPTPNCASRPVSLGHLYQALQSRFYAGQIVRCGEVYPGEHEPMITVEEFERVQKAIRHRKGSRPSKHRFVYSGLLHCGHCDRLLVGEKIRQRHGYEYVYYRCGRRREGYTVCRAPAPTEPQVTADIEAHIARIGVPEPLANWTLEAIDLWAESERASAGDLARTHRNELESAERTHRRLTDLLVAGMLDEAEYLERRTASQTRIEQLRHAVAEPTAEVDAWRAAVAELVQLASTLPRAFREGEPDERRKLIANMYENLIVTDRKTKPVLRFPFTVLDHGRSELEPVLAGDENLPSPRAIVLNRRKNARPRDERERAFHAWCTRLEEVRNHLRTNTDELETCPQARWAKEERSVRFRPPDEINSSQYH